MTEERLHDLYTVLTYEEIEELRNICYEHGSSWCPISDFFNDIERTKNAHYNKNQAFKDLWLIVNIILEKEKKLKALEIVKRYICVDKPFGSACYIRLNDESEMIPEEEYNLLKEAGL